MFRRLFAAGMALLLFAASAPAYAQSAAAGAWRFTGQYDGAGYVGIMIIDDAGQEAMIAILTTQGASVVERARISVAGTQVTVDGYEIVSSNVEGWVPDNFVLAIDGERMTGTDVDDAGQSGGNWLFFR